MHKYITLQYSMVRVVVHGCCSCVFILVLRYVSWIVSIDLFYMSLLCAVLCAVLWAVPCCAFVCACVCMYVYVLALDISQVPSGRDPGRALPPLPPLPGSENQRMAGGAPSRPSPPMGARHMRGSSSSSAAITSTPPVPARRHSEKVMNGATAHGDSGDQQPPAPVPKCFQEPSVLKPRRQPPSRPPEERSMGSNSRSSTPPVSSHDQPFAAGPSNLIAQGRAKFSGGASAPMPQGSAFQQRPSNTPPLPPTPEPSRRPPSAQNNIKSSNTRRSPPATSGPNASGPSTSSLPANRLEVLVATLQAGNPVAGREQASREAVEKFCTTAHSVMDVVQELSDANRLPGVGKVTLMKFLDLIKSTKHIGESTAKGVVTNPVDKRNLSNLVQKILLSSQKFLDTAQK